MYQGAYQSKKSPVRRRRRSHKPTLLMMALAIVLGAFVGTTVAYLFTNTDALTNTFNPAKVTTEITEDFDKNVKDNVKVKNTGDIDAYIRAAVVVTWQDVNGNVHPTAPVADADYTVNYPTNTGWVKHTDGFYYCTTAVKPNATTGILLTNCKPVEGKAPEGYHLSVEILASAIQSEPASAVQEAWNVTVNTDGTLNVGGNA